MTWDYQNNQTIHFSRWARKSWSLFAVLGRVVRIGVLAIIYLIVAEPAMAQKDIRNINSQDPEDIDVNIDEVEVLGQRVSLTHGQLARMVSVISQAEIARSSYSSVSEILDEYLSVDVRQRGPDGAQADISLNGSSFEQVLILINGIPFNNPQSGHFNGDLPVSIEIIDHIEIFPGGASRWLGPLAYAGAINIVTRGFNKESSFLEFESGQHQLFSISGVGYFGARARQLLSVEHLQHAGYQVNTDLSSSKGFYSIDWKRKQYQWYLQSGFIRKSFGAQAFYSPKYPDQFEQTTSAFVSASFERSGKVSWSHQAYLKADGDEFHLFRYEAPIWYTGPNHHLNLVGGWISNLWWQNSLGQATVGLDIRGERIYSSVLGLQFTPKYFSKILDPYGFRAQRTYWNLYAEQDYRLDRWIAVAGIMSTISVNQGVKLSLYPGLDVRYQVSNNMKAYGAVNRSMRLPTFTELYYQSPTNLGNLNLKPEQGWSSRMGISIYDWWYKLKMEAFGNYSQNEIDWVRYSGEETWNAMNIATIFRTGITGNFRMHPFMNERWNHVSLSLGYSYQHIFQVENNFDSKYTLDYLKHKIIAKIDIPISRTIDFSLNLRYQDRDGYYTDWDPQNASVNYPYQPIWLTDFKARASIRNITAWVSIQNLFNQPYMDIGPILQPGRWMRFGVKMKFSK